MVDSAISASARGASFLILVQISSRALTFLINQALLRLISPELLGASFQYELYTISVIYFAREGLRVATQRQSDSVQAIVNVAWIPVFLGIPLATGLGLLFSYKGLPPAVDALRSLWIYGFATVVELLSEPCFALMQHQLAYATRAAAETAGLLSRCAVCLGLVLWYHSTGEHLGTTPFAYGQLSYALISLMVYLWRVWPLARQIDVTLMPAPIDSNSSSPPFLHLFPRSTCVLTLSLYLQNAVKYVLTQGDALILTSLVSLYDQGAYALASNYGGLIARMIFQPIEESSRSLFSKLCSEDPKTRQAKSSSVTEASEVLSNILKAYGILALVAWAVGPTIAPQILDIIGGARWAATGAGEVLAAFCYYIPLLALNGVTEAFVAAVASAADLQRQTAVMTGFTAGFGISAFVLVRTLDLGAVGLVWTNCLNMLARIVWNWTFIQTYLADHKTKLSLMAIRPQSTSVSLAGVAIAILTQNEVTGVFKWSIPYVGKLLQDVTVSLLFGLALLIAERRFLFEGYKKFTSSRSV